MYRFEANFQSVSTDFRYETGVSTPGGLCHKADKFSVGFRAIEFERKVRSHFSMDGRSGFLWMGDRIWEKCAIEFEILGGWKSRRLETASTQTMSAGRRRRGYSEIQNHRVISSTRAPSGFCLCSRGFNRRGFSVFRWMGDGIFRWMGDRIFGWMGDCIFGLRGDRVFCGWAIKFGRNVRSNFKSSAVRNPGG
ncbi:MAG: hypothetical protein ACM65M_22215 [Microcoleus sp.]